MRELVEPDISVLRETVEASMAGAGEKELQALLGAMWLSMKHEKRDPADAMAGTRVYVRKLAAYPRDLTLELLTEWHDGRHEEFFPTCPALIKELDRRLTQRRHLLDELRNWGSLRQRKRRLKLLRMDLEYLREHRPLPPIRSEPPHTWPEWDARLTRQIAQLETMGVRA